MEQTNSWPFQSCWLCQQQVLSLFSHNPLQEKQISLFLQKDEEEWKLILSPEVAVWAADENRANQITAGEDHMWWKLWKEATVAGGGLRHRFMNSSLSQQASGLRDIFFVLFADALAHFLHSSICSTSLDSSTTLPLIMVWVTTFTIFLVLTSGSSVAQN